MAHFFPLCACNRNLRSSCVVIPRILELDTNLTFTKMFDQTGFSYSCVTNPNNLQSENGQVMEKGLFFLYIFARHQYLTLTHSHTITHLDVSGKEALSNHFGKRIKCW